jgi:APA family basic amino acid/polyamine antiporter
MSLSPQQAPPLRRAIGLLRATSLVAGTILGASVFVQPAEISRLVPAPSAMLAVWGISGLLTLCGALVSAELASAFPRTGGVYVFLSESFSPLLGFLWGWAMFWVVHSGIIAATCVIAARFAGSFVELSEAGERGVAVAAVLLLSVVNYLGVRPGSSLQTALTAAKLGAVLILLAAAFAHSPPAHPAAGGSLPAAAVESGGLRAFGLAVVAGLFTFGGWHVVTYTAGETREPQRTIPRALLLGTAVVTGCYVALNAAYLRVLPPERMAASTRVAAEVAEAMAGPRAAAAVSALVMISALGVASGMVLAGPRVYMAMAQDGLFPRWLAAVHPERLTPHRAIAAQAVWTSLLVVTATYSELFRRVIYTEWIFFALMAAGVMRLRGKASYAPAYRLRAAGVLVGVFVLASAAIVLNEFLDAPANRALGILLLAAGIPVGRFFVHREEHKPHARD